jgi:predicted O-methyltransferase YrrM
VVARAPDTVAGVLVERLKDALAQAGRTRLGRNLILAAVVKDPRRARFDSVRSWPESIAGFEDLAFLFSSNQLNHGVVSQQFDEAALLYRVARRVGAGTIAEIGRFKGGSTFLLAAALEPGGEVWSYDLHVPGPGLDGAALDRSLLTALGRYGLEGRVRLIVGDSRSAEAPPRPCDLVLIDGDHSYEGVRADWERWRNLVAPGGHVLFHDAVDNGGFGTFCDGVGRLVGEIERLDEGFRRDPGAGSLAHFVRR